ncbi:unnamed protein product [Cuscuta campestris]|uniref:Uncharacterized protein n=1 Tax=Cuscuta campestris TaxID=132261 RepID=A0A484LWS1_9ASTE|nr:unnamed protein product [Cuscuta campestris]
MMRMKMKIRELHEKSVKMEINLQFVEVMRVELMRVCADIKDLNGAKQEHTTEIQGMTEDLKMMNTDLQQTPTINAEIENLRQELQRSRAAIEDENEVDTQSELERSIGEGGRKNGEPIIEDLQRRNHSHRV